MKYLPLLLLLALPAVQVRAQTLTVDHVFAAEDSSQLWIAGRFGPRMPTVTVDGTILPVLSWNDSLVVCPLPDTGKGSAGKVEVQDGLGGYDSRMLTRISFRYYYHYGHFPHHTDYDITGAFRVDLDWARGNAASNFRLSNSTGARVEVDENTYVPNRGYGICMFTAWPKIQDTTGYTTGFRLGSSTHVSDQRFVFQLTDFVCLTQPMNVGPVDFEYPVYTEPIEIQLDSARNPRSYSYESGPDYGNQTADGIRDTADFLPSYTHFAPIYPVVLIDGGVDSSAGDSARLRWNSLLSEKSYEVELAQDSLFARGLLDTVVTSTSMLLPLERDARYYWRVRAVDSGVFSQWSEPKSFSLQRAGVDRSGGNLLQSPRLTGSLLSLPSACDVHVYDVMGRERFRRFETAHSTLDLRLLRLRAGVYFVEAGNEVFRTVVLQN